MIGIGCSHAVIIDCGPSKDSRNNPINACPDEFTLSLLEIVCPHVDKFEGSLPGAHSDGILCRRPNIERGSRRDDCTAIHLAAVTDADTVEIVGHSNRIVLVVNQKSFTKAKD